MVGLRSVPLSVISQAGLPTANAETMLVFDCNSPPELRLSGENNTQAVAAHGGARPESAAVAAHEVVLCGWSDADWAGSQSDRRSTTGFILFLCGAPIAWQSKRQASVAQSTAEAEYMAVSALLRDVKWLHALLCEIGVRSEKPKPFLYEGELEQAEQSEDESSQLRFSPPTVLHCDNQSTVAMCNAEGDLHRRAKHIDVRHHWIREAVQQEEVALQWVPTGEQLADIFTKALDKQTFKRIRRAVMGRSVSRIASSCSRATATNCRQLARSESLEWSWSGRRRRIRGVGAC